MTARRLVLLVIVLLSAASLPPGAVAAIVGHRVEPARPSVGPLFGKWRYVCRDGRPIGGPLSLVLGPDGTAQQIVSLAGPKGVDVTTYGGTWKAGGESPGHAGWKEMTSYWDDGKTMAKWRYYLVPEMDVLEVVEENGRHADAVVLYVREK